MDGSRELIHSGARSRRPALLVVMVLTALAYSAALEAPLQFDDIASIPENPTIRRLWPPSIALHPPAGSTAVSGRPVVNYSLALNYAVNDWLGIEQGLESEGPLKTVSYHILNTLLHLASGALLFGIVCRTFRQERVGAEWARMSESIAAVVTGLWLLHPIQSEAVNYVVQRTELIVSACYLGTLYGSIRAWEARSRGALVGWYAAAVATCLLGMGSKEVMITAPLAVVLYDRAFRLTSWSQVARVRRGRAWFYLALAATGTWSLALIASGPRTGTVGFNLGITWYQYLYSQAWAISHYVRLVLWPDPLIIDYGQDPVTGLAGVPGLILLTAFGAATMFAWVRANTWGWFGFLGAWFFMLLAPSSSFVPITTEIAAERRIYLALVSVLVLLVIAAESLRRRIVAEPASRRWWLGGTLAAVGLFYLAATRSSSEQLGTALGLHEQGATSAADWTLRLGIAMLAVAAAWNLLRATSRRWVLGGIGALLAAATFERSRAYAHPEILWRAVVARSPRSARAYNGSGYALLLSDASRLTEAQPLFSQAIALDSTYLPAWRSLAVIAMKQGRFEDARTILGRELSIDPNYADAVARMGQVLTALREPERAIPYLERAASKDLGEASLMALGTAYLATARPKDAEGVFRRVLDRAPARADAMRFLGDALIKQGRAVEAAPFLETAATREPGSGFGWALLSMAYAQSDRAREAAAAAESAVARADGEPIVYFLAGQAMVRANRNAEAERYLSETVRLAPDYLPAHQALAELERRARR
jgi:tetratricopeptide (TPR) repeat protein